MLIHGESGGTYPLRPIKYTHITCTLPPRQFHCALLSWILYGCNWSVCSIQATSSEFIATQMFTCQKERVVECSRITCFLHPHAVCCVCARELTCYFARLWRMRVTGWRACRTASRSRAAPTTRLCLQPPPPANDVQGMFRLANACFVCV